jgi:hypothetical protein
MDAQQLERVKRTGQAELFGADDFPAVGPTSFEAERRENLVVNLSRDHKPVVVHVAPTKQFRTIKTFDDIKGLLAQGDSDSVERIASELHLHVA